MTKNMKEIKISLKTLAIKARVYNQIKEEDKVKFFDKWFQLNYDAHWELNNYKTKRKEKARIVELRTLKTN